MYTKQKVGPTILKIDQVLSPEECKVLYDYSLGKTNNPVEDPTQVPWTMSKSNTLYYRVMTNPEVRAIIKKYV